jgi:hypothetical protein
VRSSVINGCRSALRRRVRQLTLAGADLRSADVSLAWCLDSWFDLRERVPGW